MKSCLIVIRNEKDLKYIKRISECSHFVLVALQIMIADEDGRKVPFSQNKKKIEKLAKEELMGLSYELAFPEYDLIGLPAEKFVNMARKKSCEEIIVFTEMTNRINSVYSDNLASTLAVTSDIPIRVIKV